MTERENLFDEPIAARYDEDSAGMFNPVVVSATVDFLAELAGDGAALEFGIGTGRIALPLSARGVPVQGIDLSPEMVAQLRAKQGSDAIEVTIGDFAATVVPGSFRLVYLVYNTISNLTSQDDQVACFVNVGRHLAPGGCFVIEVGVPPLRQLPPGQSALPFMIEPGRLGFDTFDVAHQRGVSHHYWLDGGRSETFSFPYRYTWPAELDLMARIGGMRLRERWSDWRRTPFTSESASHVSVWEKLPGE